MRKVCWITAFAWLAVVSSAVLAEENAARENLAPGVYVILDGSGSMWGQLADGTHKITAAREVLKRFSADDYAGRELAFRVYGHRREGDCTDSELVVPFGPPEGAISRMSSFADGVNPKGKTPISLSLRAALEDFGDRPGEIVLVSDGIETCDEDPCALVREWREKNVAIRVHVVGLGLEEKERAAMSCISEAAGTEYQDAQSADELAVGLERIQEAAAEPGPPIEPDFYALDIRATNEAGDLMRVEGFTRHESGESMPVSGDGNYRVPAGINEVTVGVKTWNGNLYKPVTRSIDVGADGKTRLDVVVPEPPSVRAKFIERGDEIHGSQVTGYQDGDEVFSFRAVDRAYIDPGTYEFRATPNADNELSVTEAFVEGDHKEIVFELTHTVHVSISMVSSSSEIEFVSNFELRQDGEKKYDVHRHNGVRALPGTYDLRLPLRLTPHVHEGLVLTGEDEQEFRIEVPVGHVTVVYEQADGTRFADGERFSMKRLEAGRYQSDRISSANQRIPLVAGTYRIEGWSHLGEFDELHFEIAVGDEREFVLRSKR